MSLFTSYLLRQRDSSTSHNNHMPVQALVTLDETQGDDDEMEEEESKKNTGKTTVQLSSAAGRLSC